MMGQRTLESFPVEIPREHAYRLLDIHGPGRLPRESLLEMFEEEYAGASDLVEARAVMRWSRGGLPGCDHFAPDMPLVAVVCTIGEALEERVREHTQRGESARAMVLDAIGSSAAETVADLSNRLICRKADATGHAPASRRSPGYGTWSIRDQEAIFRFLDPGEIAVTLMESCMMVPRKSVSYVVPLKGGKPGEGLGHRCHLCGLEDCRFRSEGDQT